MKFAIRQDELRRTLEIAGETWRKVAKWVCDSELWRNSPFAMANCGESPQMANRKAKFVAKANFVANANVFPLVIYITQPLLQGGSNFSVKQYKEHVSPFASTRLAVGGIPQNRSLLIFSFSYLPTADCRLPTADSTTDHHPAKKMSSSRKRQKPSRDERGGKVC